VVNFLVVSGIMFGRNSRDALFLVYFGVQYLPYMYFANAASLIISSIVYTTLIDRFERGKFLASTALLFVAILVCSRLVLIEHPRWFFPVLYVIAQIIWAFTLMQFWTFVGDLFDTRQSKRIFPFLAVGALLGMVGVGLFSKKLVAWMGTENLLLVWAGLILVATILAGYIYLRHRPPKEPVRRDAASLPKPVRPSELQKIRDGFREVGQQPLLRSMAGYILLMWTVYAVVDFCYSKTLRARYPNPNDLATFLGFFVGAQGVLCLAIQLFLTRAVIARLGVGRTINFHPGFLVAGTAWMSFGFGFPAVLTTKLGDASMLYTFSDSSYQLLYNPVSPANRARVRGFIEGYLRPLSLAAAGLFIIVGNKYLHPIQLASGTEISVPQQLSWVAAVLSLLWLGTALTTNKGYIRALLNNLESDNPALRHAAATALTKLKDPGSVATFVATLRNTPADRLVPALKLFETLNIRQAQDQLLELLNHEHPRVRASVVSCLGRKGITGLEGRITPLLRDADARVRANAVEALGASPASSTAEVLSPLLQDLSTRVRINAAIALANLAGSGTPPLETLPFIKELARGDEASRSAATFALGRLPAEDSLDILTGLLKDPVSHIRCEAARALGRVGTPRVIPNLIEALGGAPELRHHARLSLGAILRKCGNVCVDEIIGIALSTDHVEIRSELADVLGRLKDTHVIDPLLKLLQDPEWRVRWKVLKSFEKLARDAPLPAHAREALFGYAHTELTAFRYSLECTRALVPSPATVAEELLAVALEEDRANIQERVFRMLGVLCGREVMREIAHELQSKDPRQRADALEALDTLAPKVVGRELLAILEPAPQTSADTTSSEAALVSLVNHPKPWIRACAGHYVGYHDQPGRDASLEGLLNDRVPLVRETALGAGWRVDGESWKARLEAASKSEDTRLRQAAHALLARGSNDLEIILRSPHKGESMLLAIEKAAFLKSAPLFAALESEELAALAEIAIESAYAPGEVIFEEKQEAHHLYVILQGKVEVFLKVNDHLRPLAHLGEKECFGEMAILDNQPRSASVRAEEATTVLKIDRESFHELIMERPQIAFSIFRILSGRLRQQNLEADHAPAVFIGGKYA
jgi:HEAT repeat protein